MSRKTALVACGVFAPEFQIMDGNLRDGFDAVFVDSMLHLEPGVLDERIGGVLDGLGTEALILYGDCWAHALEMGSRKGRVRTQGINCCEIMLGSNRFRELRRAGAFFMMPEWIDRWEEIFKARLGFKDEKLAKEFMADTMKKIVYLDTGSRVPPLKTLAAISDYLGLPFEIEPTGTRHLEASLRAALSELHDA
jgi:hypothetical protein